MESKKLQQLQQANSHLAPQPMPHTKAPSYHPGSGDYRASHSPVFQNSPQYHSLSSNFAQINLTGGQQQQGQQRLLSQQQLQHQLQQQQQLSSGNHLHVKPIHQTNHGTTTSLRYSQQQQLLQQPSQPQVHQQTPLTQQSQSFYASEQLYQNNRDRLYQQAAAVGGAANATSPRSMQSIVGPHSHNHPMSALQQQYQQLQQQKIQQQIQVQAEAALQQQRTFAMRQQLNPPIPQSHFHMTQSQSQISTRLHQQQHQQQQHQHQQLLRNIPPSTLNLTSQCQPATGPVKLNQSEMHSIYGSTVTGGASTSAVGPSHHNSKLIYEQQLKSPITEHTPMLLNNSNYNQHSDMVVPKTPDESPVHQPLDRKKSVGSIQSLKSPLTKRPVSAPVTLSGWLYKQGSDGLKVWRKRWFVLSEYCLFYYKGPEEEKLLGSILLPSYRVAACSAEDKIYRKYAFKCEHQNMRTYWLAAETADIMGQWVRALTAATMMQGSSESSDHASQPSVSSLNPSGENSDSGIHTYQSQQSKLSVLPNHGPVTPASDGGAGGTTASVGACITTSNGPQPLYANAPPKPRRANDGGYSSPSPENSIER